MLDFDIFVGTHVVNVDNAITLDDEALELRDICISRTHRCCIEATDNKLAIRDRAEVGHCAC